MSLNSRKLLKTEKLRVPWKIQSAIKSERNEELGWNSENLFLLMIPTNGQNLKQIGAYQIQTLGEVDWTDLYTWKEAIDNFWTPTSPTNAYI